MSCKNKDCCQKDIVSEFQERSSFYKDNEPGQHYGDEVLKKMPYPDNEPSDKNKELAEEGGRKFDGGKVRLELIPPELLFAVGDILTMGAKKYGCRNWEKGMSWSRVFGALNRHLWTWWWCDDVDEESKKSHLHHAACCIAFLIAYESRGVGTDDRSVKPG